MQWVAIAAAAMQVVGAISGAKEKSKQLEAYAQANQYNAAVMRQRADATRSSYGQREEQQRRQARFALGQDRAAMGQSGLGLGGSNDDINDQSEVLAEMDALNIRYGGELEAHGLLTQARMEDWQAQSNRDAKRGVKRGMWLGIAGGMLSGAGGYLKGGGTVPSWGSASTAMPRSYSLNGSYPSGNVG